MTTARKIETNPVESRTCEIVPESKPLFKYTLRHKDMSADAFMTDKWSAVVNELVQDDNFNHLALDWYMDQLEGQFSDTGFLEYIHDHAKALAIECGYSIWEAGL